MNLPFLHRKRCVPEESVAAARVEGTQPSGCSAGSWSQCASKLNWRLPMNLKMHSLIINRLRIWGFMGRIAEPLPNPVVPEHLCGMIGSCGCQRGQQF